MFLRSFVKNNLLIRSMDPLKRKSPVLYSHMSINKVIYNSMLCPIRDVRDKRHKHTDTDR